MFICLLCFTKAVILELVEGICTALRSFIAKRGGCDNIYLDCGNKYNGAASYL